MLYALELLIVAVLGIGVRRVLCRGNVENGLVFGAYMAAVAAAWLVGFLCDWAFSVLTHNLALRLAGTALCGTAVFIGVVACARHWRNKKDRDVVRRWEARWRAPTWAKRVVTALLLAAWLTLHALALFVVVNLFAMASDGWHKSLDEDTLLANALLIAPGGRATPPSDAESQAVFLAKLRISYALGLESIGDSIGARALSDRVSAVQEILALSDDERARLVEEIPELSRLVNNAALQRAIHDERIMDLIAAVARGSITAIYDLGSEPNLIALFSDPDIRAAIAAIDIMELNERIRTERERVAAHWMLASMQSSLELDATLANETLWSLASDSTRLAWRQDCRFGLAKTAIAIAESARLTMRVTTAAHVTVWIDDRNTIGKRDGDAIVYAIEGGAAARAVVVMLDLSAGDRACAVDVRNRLSR